MKKIYLLLAFLSAFAISHAQKLDVSPSKTQTLSKSVLESENTFGYCVDNDLFYYLRNSSVGMNGTEVQAAIYIPAEIAQELKGNLINKIRIGFNNPSRRDVEIFIREDLNGENLFSLKNQQLKNVGWNEVSLDTPFEITENGFYVGYKFHYYYNSTLALALVDMVSFNENARWLKFGNDEWDNEMMANYGSLLIQIVMEGDKQLPGELGMQDIILPESSKSDADIEVNPVVRNFGGEAINGYNLYYSVDNGQETKIEFAQNSITSNATDTASITININEPNVELHSIKLRCEAIDANQDSNKENNEISKDIIVYDNLPEKKVLLEVFTGMECAYCHEGSEHLDQYLQDFEGKYAEVKHHTYSPGGRFDVFAVYRSYEYLRYFSDQNAAPLCMINRHEFPGTPLVFEVNAYDQGKMVEDLLKEPVFTSVNIDSEFNADTRELKLKVYGYNYINYDDLDNMSVHVVLTENGQQNWQNSSTGVVPDYIHNNIARIFVTEGAGDQISSGIGNYEKNYTITIPETIEGYSDGTFPNKSTTLYPENMEIIAYVANFDREDKYNCEVINLNYCKLGESISSTSIKESLATEKASAYYSNGMICINGDNNGIKIYNLQGNLVKSEKAYTSEIDASGMQEGIYLVVIKNADDTLSVSKILID